LAKVGDLPAPNPKAQRPRFLVLADGLDELAPLDPRFPDLVKDLALPGTVWVQAGRPEQGLTAAFDAPGCEAVFGPGGLPLMSPEDIREMLEQGLGLGRHALLRRDDEKPDGAIVNPFVDRVVTRAQGLPIYVHLLLEDLRRGHFTVNDEAKLPEGLIAYYDELLHRVGLSTVKHDLSMIVCLLAKAAEPVDAAGLAILVAGGVADAERLGYQEEIEKALRAGRALLRLAPTPDGAEGWTLYHQSFREYVAGRPATPERDLPATLPAPALAGLVRRAEDRLVQAAEWWQELPAGNLRNHMFRRGVPYALTWGGEKGLQAARGRLSHFAYLMARLESLPLADLTGLEVDYDSVLSRLSGPVRDGFRTWVAFVCERLHILFRGDECWPANRILLQLAHEHSDDSPVTRQAEAWVESGACKWKWLCRTNRRSRLPEQRQLAMVLTGHSIPPDRLAVSPKGMRAATTAFDYWNDRTFELFVWDLSTRTALASFAIHDFGLRTCECPLSVTDGGEVFLHGQPVVARDPVTGRLLLQDLSRWRTRSCTDHSKVGSSRWRAVGPTVVLEPFPVQSPPKETPLEPIVKEAPLPLGAVRFVVPTSGVREWVAGLGGYQEQAVYFVARDDALDETAVAEPEIGRFGSDDGLYHSGGMTFFVRTGGNLVIDGHEFEHTWDWGDYDPFKEATRICVAEAPDGVWTAVVDRGILTVESTNGEHWSASVVDQLLGGWASTELLCAGIAPGGQLAAVAVLNGYAEREVSLFQVAIVECSRNGSVIAHSGSSWAEVVAAAPAAAAVVWPYACFSGGFLCPFGCTIDLLAIFCQRPDGSPPELVARYHASYALSAVLACENGHPVLVDGRGDLIKLELKGG
jgi:hypothetical protein